MAAKGSPVGRKIWLITGASSGLGRALALQVLKRGDFAIPTARDPSKLDDLVQQFPSSCHALQLDLHSNDETIHETANQAIAVWGQVDVVVNNAGRSHVATLEDGGAKALMDMFQLHVLGAVTLTNAFIPAMRVRSSGSIVFIGSRSGWRTDAPTNGPYGGTKAAVHAIADTYRAELAPFNIHVLTVIPSSLRTSNISNLVMQAPSERNAAYEPLYGAVDRLICSLDGKQAGDPDIAARLIVDAIDIAPGAEERGPRKSTLFLGNEAIRDVRKRCEDTLAIIKDQEEVAATIDHVESSKTTLLSHFK